MSYYSALDKADTALAYDPVDSVDLPHNSFARAWDLEEAGCLPPEFDRAACLYAEPPWRAGYEAFRRRAGAADGRSFRHLMGQLGAVLGAWDRPAVIICGRQMVALLPPAAGVLENVRLDHLRQGDGWIALLYGAPPPPSTGDLLASLANAYGMLGDPFCGFGNTGRVAAQHGGGFVMSDINPRCIGRIAAEAPGWFVR